MEGDVISVLALCAMQLANAEDREVFIGPDGDAATLEEAWRSGKLWPTDIAVLLAGYDPAAEPSQPIQVPMPGHIEAGEDTLLPSLIIPKGMTVEVEGGLLTGQQRLLVEHGGVLIVRGTHVKGHEGIALGGGGYLEVDGGLFEGSLGPVIAMDRGVANIDNSTFNDNTGVDWRPGDIDSIGKGEWTLVRGSSFVDSGNLDFPSDAGDTTLGGSIRSGGTHLVVRGSSFEGNQASQGAGGAIAVLRIPGEDTRPLMHIEDSQFKFTSAGISGGAIAAVDVGGRIVQSTFIGNSVTDSESAGGAIATTWSNLEIDGSSFKEQTVGASSTGIAAINSNLRVSRSDFASSQQGLSAGGILASAPSEDLPAETVLRVFHSSFEGGNATLGGALVHAGGRVDLFGNTFVDSGGGVGGAAALIETWGRVHANTFTNAAALYGGALAMGDADLQVQDNTFLSPVAVEGAAMLWTQSWRLPSVPLVRRNRVCNPQSTGYTATNGDYVRAAAIDLRTTYGEVSNNLVWDAAGAAFAYGMQAGSDPGLLTHNTVVGADAALLAGDDYEWWDNLVVDTDYGFLATNRYTVFPTSDGGFNVFFGVSYISPTLGGYDRVPSDSDGDPLIPAAMDCFATFAPGAGGSAYQNAHDGSNRGWDGGEHRAGVDWDGDGVPVEEDCDDQSLFGHLRFPGNVEVCDGYDNDCDGLIDEDAEDARLFFPDVDGDGLGDSRYPDGIRRCRVPGFVDNRLDCDDQDASIPGPEVLNNYADENCDGIVEWDCWWDQDQDGHPKRWAIALPSADLCQPPPEDAVEDCDDFDLDVFPGASDIPLNGIDENCDGTDAVARLAGGACSTTDPVGLSWLALALLGLLRRR